MIAVSIAMAFWTALLVWMHVRTEQRRRNEPTTMTEANSRSELGQGTLEQDHPGAREYEKHTNTNALSAIG